MSRLLIVCGLPGAGKTTLAEALEQRLGAVRLSPDDALGAAVELHVVNAPTDVLYERIRRRGRELPPITREAVEAWAAAFEALTEEERGLYDKAP